MNLLSYQGQNLRRDYFEPIPGAARVGDKFDGNASASEVPGRGRNRHSINAFVNGQMSRHPIFFPSARVRGWYEIGTFRIGTPRRKSFAVISVHNSNRSDESSSRW